jgi:3-oxoacyl-ACP reductase-like protein
MRKNHSTGKRLGILATGLAASAIALAAAVGVAAYSPASSPGDYEGAPAATSAAQQHVVLAAAPTPFQEVVTAAPAGEYEG